jgi:hypothetical protein
VIVHACDEDAGDGVRPLGGLSCGIGGFYGTSTRRRASWRGIGLPHDETIAIVIPGAELVREGGYKFRIGAACSTTGARVITNLKGARVTGGDIFSKSHRTGLSGFAGDAADKG